MPNPELQRHAALYASLSGIALNLKTPLGYGNDGAVWTSNRKSAVKAFERPGNYYNEIGCYQRFRDHDVKSIRGLSVPQLMGYDEGLLVIEMRLVSPPFLLDFGKAHLDVPPRFPRDIMEQWEQDGKEMFGKRWKDVGLIIAALKSYGIYYYDAKPGNINFGDPDDAR
jgi:hypothetical protein